MIRIITLVQGDKTLTPATLSSKLECDKRSLFRYLNDLKEAGVPIDFDKQINGYVIRRDFFLRATELSLDESLALCLLASHLHAEQLPHIKPAARAIEKIRSTLPMSVRDELESLVPLVHIDLARRENEGAGDVFETVRSAIIHRRALDCEYESPRKKPSDSGAFRFEPYALYFGQRAWYVIGKRHADGEVRTLKICRFAKCRETEIAFTMPDDFSLKTHFGQAWRMIKGAARHHVELLFDKHVAETVADTWWHDSQDIEFHADNDSVTLHFDIDGLDEIVWWVLSYGPNCKVIHPAELRDKVIEMIDQTKKNYFC